MWLRTNCSHSDFVLTNKEFCTALCLRYFEEIPYLASNVVRCPYCKNNQNIVDPYGHHYISACNCDVNQDGHAQRTQPHAIHDQMRYTLYRIAKHAMTFAVEEPKRLFNINTDDKPDLLLQFAQDNVMNKKFAVDITITCPFFGSRKGELSIPQAPASVNVVESKDHHDKRAIVKRDAKIKHYGQWCKDVGIEFVPFVMYSTGKIHKEGLTLLKKLATHGSEARNIPEKILLKYYKKLLSFALIRYVTRSIYIKSMVNVSRNYNHRDIRAFIKEGNILALEQGSSRVSLHNNAKAT